MRDNRGELMLWRNDASDVVDDADYERYKKYLVGKSSEEWRELRIGCLYYGEGRLGEGAFRDCESGVAVFHDYSVG